MAALQSRAFADAGWTTLQLDLHGCGDSSGDFSEATWERWVCDVVEACTWLSAKTGHRPLLWGLRTGCLLAAQAAARTQHTPDLVLWQPVHSGAQYLRQFLRLKGASELMAQAGQSVTGTKELRSALARGETVEIAGYPLTPVLASALEAAQLELPARRARVAWFEVRGTGDGELAPMSRERVRALSNAGHDVTTQVVQGPAFWHIVEAEACSALIDSTLAITRGWQP